MKNREPVPIRSDSDWKQLAAFTGKTSAEVLGMLKDRAKVVCRECMGFGHTRTNCPSRKKLSEFSILSPVNQSFVAAYRFTIS